MRASQTTLLTAMAGLAALATFVAAPSSMAAQNLSFPYPYPANDTPLALRSGTVVRTRDLVVFHGHNVSSLDVVIETPTPASDTARMASEAREIANLHDAFARANGLNQIMVSVCRTQACLEMRELSKEVFEFVPAADGRWTRSPSMPSRR